MSNEGYCTQLQVRARVSKVLQSFVRGNEVVDWFVSSLLQEYHFLTRPGYSRVSEGVTRFWVDTIGALFSHSERGVAIPAPLKRLPLLQERALSGFVWGNQQPHVVHGHQTRSNSIHAEISRKLVKNIDSLVLRLPRGRTTFS